MDILLLTGLLFTIFPARTPAWNCSGSCLPSRANKTYPCNPFTQECLYGCKDGFFGSTCSEKCSSVNSKCASCHVGSDSVLRCTGCITNYYLNNGVCRECVYWCADRDGATCDPQTGQCLYGCKRDRYGRYCDKYCSFTCNRGVCDQLTGTCIYGCNPSAYCGQTCQISCSEGCSASCYQNCSCDYDCTVSTWGQYCDHMCSPNCRKPANGSAPVCDSRDGSCIHGCVSDTSWGSDCKNLCSRNCKNATCQQDTGICTDGCESGWYGDKCSFKVQASK